MKTKEIATLFKARKVTIKMKREYEKNPMVIHLPVGVGSIEDDLAFEKVRIDYRVIRDQTVFSVCIDDFLYINKDFKLTDIEESRAYFGKDAKGSKGVSKAYSSIDARAIAVITAIIEGKIKLGDT